LQEVEKMRKNWNIELEATKMEKLAQKMLDDRVVGHLWGY